MLYSGKDLKTVLTQLIIWAAIDLIILAASIAFGFIISMDKDLVIGTIIMIAGLFLFIFVLGNFALPCFYYYRYLMDVFTGRYSKRAGNIAKISKKPLYKDNKNYYYEIDVDLGGGMCGMLLYDANIGKPDFNVGEHKSFVCYENFIVKVEE